MKFLLPSYLILLSFLSNQAQENPLSVMEEILINIHGAGSHAGLPPPSIKMNTHHQTKGARYSKSENTIVIDQKVYDACASMGRDAKNALAYVIGHQLAHAYHEVGSEGFFVEHATNSSEIERKADELGLLFATLAGYECYRKNVYETVLRKIYVTYKNNGNEVLAERIKIANTVRKNLDSILIYIKAGLHLYQCGMSIYGYGYDFLRASTNCLTSVKKLLEDQNISSFAVENNLAEIDLWWAISNIWPSPQFIFPFEQVSPLITHSRLNITLEKGPSFEQKLAERYVEIDSQLSKLTDRKISVGNHVAYINLVTAHILKAYVLRGEDRKKELEIALNKLAILEQKSGELPADAYSLRGIAHANLKQPIEAEAAFKKAKELNAYKAVFNYQGSHVRYKNLRVGMRSLQPFDLFLKMGVHALDSLENAFPKPYNIQTSYTEDTVKIWHLNREEDGYYALKIRHSVKSINYTHFILSTYSNYEGKSMSGAGIGSTETDLKVSHSYFHAPPMSISNNRKVYKYEYYDKNYVPNYIYYEVQNQEVSGWRICKIVWK